MRLCILAKRSCWAPSAGRYVPWNGRAALYSDITYLRDSWIADRVGMKSVRRATGTFDADPAAPGFNGFERTPLIVHSASKANRPTRASPLLNSLLSVTSPQVARIRIRSQSTRYGIEQFLNAE